MSLRYRPSTELVLKNLSFNVEPGIKVGVVGRTGAGKSTISLALTRIVELCEGQILIDGVGIESIALADLRSKITIIAQDPTLFTGTLRFNLDPFHEFPSSTIEALLIRAGLSDLLTRDPESKDGSDTSKQASEQGGTSSRSNSQSSLASSKRLAKKQGKGIYFKIAENGSNLSAGERQLVCICRAILRKNRVVILDEATANIDIVTEQKIQNLIENEFKSSTVITIAHRLNTIIKSDKVLVLGSG